MNKKNISVILGSVGLSLLLSGCPATSATSVLNQVANPVSSVAAAADTGSSEAVTYKNKGRNFSFTIPAGWSKQSGDANSETALFMKMPIKTSCSFQFHMTRMKLSFPAEAAVKASLKSSKEDIQIDKLLSAKRRDESGKENGKTVKFTRGWEIVEAPKTDHQRIIYQAYDRENYYFNMMAAASTPEQFTQCKPELRKIIDSIKFGD
ncbi:MAG: hypothetical protein GQ569_05715 [Methylococcaceae bacterium]|nr:hypothetical protein [Methylococcaceae bacterium]